jgi:hypothetical protein
LNDELQKALAEFVRLLTTTAQQGSDFAIAQVPSLLQQLLRWSFYSALIWVAVGAAMVVTCWRIWPHVYQHYKRSNDFEVSPSAATFATVIGAVVGCLLMITNAMDALQITIAPKVWLLEWALAHAHGK